MLRVFCETTGMGFAAVARVTDGSWTACAVQDNIQFGLCAGGELDVDTTLCKEVRQARAPIVDPRPAELRAPRILATVQLFAELIGLQLEIERRRDRADEALLDEREAGSTSASSCRWRPSAISAARSRASSRS